MFGTIKIGDITLHFSSNYDMGSVLIVEGAVSGESERIVLDNANQLGQLIAHCMLGDDQLDRDLTETLVDSISPELRFIP